jgi:hypothetical protein
MGGESTVKGVWRVVRGTILAFLFATSDAVAQPAPTPSDLNSLDFSC